MQLTGHRSGSQLTPRIFLFRNERSRLQESQPDAVARNHPEPTPLLLMLINKVQKFNCAARNSGRDAALLLLNGQLCPPADARGCLKVRRNIGAGVFPAF